jgi:UDP:flavonoid glycosyltransferase YjiC (YdhE family)
MTFVDAASPKLAALARQMLAQPCFRDNARRIARIYAQLDGPGLAAEAILEYAGETAARAVPLAV